MKFVAPLFFATAVLFAPAEVGAQETGKFAVGVSFSGKPTVGDRTHTSGGFGVLWRFGHGHEGWGWQYGFNWYSADLDRSAGGQRLDFGELNIKPVMAGYGYTHVVNPRTKISGSLLGGYAFTTFTLREPFARAYIIEHNIDTVDVEASSAFVMKPEISGWYDINRKIGLNVSVGYMFARPNVTLITPLGRERSTANADTFVVKAGVVYSIF